MFNVQLVYKAFWNVPFVGCVTLPYKETRRVTALYCAVGVLQYHKSFQPAPTHTRSLNIQ